jgi:RNA polymerase sigma-70 factor, ECF subfamily
MAILWLEYPVLLTPAGGACPQPKLLPCGKVDTAEAPSPSGPESSARPASTRLPPEAPLPVETALPVVAAPADAPPTPEPPLDEPLEEPVPPPLTLPESGAAPEAPLLSPDVLPEPAPPDEPVAAPDAKDCTPDAADPLLPTTVTGEFAELQATATARDSHRVARAKNREWRFIPRAVSGRAAIGSSSAKKCVSRIARLTRLHERGGGIVEIVRRPTPWPAGQAQQGPSLRLVGPSGRPDNPDPPAATDAEIVEALCAGDAWAEVVVWQRYATLVHQVAQRGLGSRHEAEDVLQQVFFCLFTRIRTLKKPSALRSFIFSITVRVLKSELRRRRIRRWVTLSDTGELPDVGAPGVDPGACDLLRRFYRVLDRLGAEDRTIFVLRNIEEMTLEEVAELTELSLATVKRRLRKSNQKVTEAFEHEVERTSALRNVRRNA